MTDLERRLEELFMDDSRSRTITRVAVARRRRSPLFIALVAAGAAALAIAAGLTLGSLRDARQEVAQPSGSPAGGASPAAGGPSASPARAAEYRSPLGYTVRLPEGWRRSELQSRLSPPPSGQGDPGSLALEVFTTLAPDEEQRAISGHVNATGLGPAQVYTAYVSKDANSRRLTHGVFAESERGIYGFQPVSTEEILWYGRPAAKNTWRDAGGDTFYTIYVRDQAGHIWRIGYYLGYPGQQPPPGANATELRAIVESFRSVTPFPIPSPQTAPFNEDFGIITVVSDQGGRAGMSVVLRGEREANASMHLGSIALTLQGRPAGAVSPDGRRFAFWSSADPRGPATALKLWDAAAPTTVSTLVDASVGGQDEYGDGVVWSSDGQGLLLSYSSTVTQPGTPPLPVSGSIRTYDFATRRPGLVSMESGGALLPVAWDRARSVVAYVAVSREVTNYTVLRRGGDTTRVPIPDSSNVTASPDGTWVVATVAIPRTFPGSSKLRAWPLESPGSAVELVAPDGNSLRAGDWHPARPQLVVTELQPNGAPGGVVAIWGPATRQRAELQGERSATHRAVHRADGSGVYLPKLLSRSGPSRAYELHELASGRRSDLPESEGEFFAGVRLR